MLDPSPSFSAVAEGDRLRSHLEATLDNLSNDLPSYYHEQLLDDLCFLFRSPLFLYAMSPRLRRASEPEDTSTIGMLTPQSLNDEISHNPKSDMSIANLKMDVEWDGDSWTTRLLYGDSTLIEGRQSSKTRETGFVQSFHWFCDEARFLCCEFSAREHAAAVQLGTTIDTEPVDVEVSKTRAASKGNKKRRIVKLKIRYTRTPGERRKEKVRP
ncbi:hypothetical protein BDW02DRAFT_512829 [Decorospora gaudefroyi]|uniref:Uncharacterized protein n=1 Tax=Decorospora gaudefroyi TaxID=184978 RepID=A0A6A5JWM5_9PLEO|nr:hypothetical protein BDW02DRAFT_512829 [Decorospora gaudefroyi]